MVIAEVKTNQTCTLNGPWTQEKDQNVHRVLAAIGCLPHCRIPEAAEDIYRVGAHVCDRLRIRLVAVGRYRNNELATQHPGVTQLIWPDLLAFIWDRFDTYRNQKTQVDQWDREGLKIKQLADEPGDEGVFIDKALRLMGVQNISQTS